MDVAAHACVRSVMSVTTSVGDLHKAPFQSCSVRRRVMGRGGGREGGGGLNKQD